VGVARGAVLEFKGVPILPVPYISFPLSDKRKSGLLPPTMGSTAPTVWSIPSPITGTSHPTATPPHAP
jgi:lipopolysaccharide assembly outer membrane protein LptD (OstA)